MTMTKGLFAECRTFQLKPWQCPPVLFIIMGFFIIFSMLATYALAQRYSQEPEIAALAVIAVAIVSLVIGTFIVNGFNRIVDSHRIKSQFISLASHQLRSPLSVLKWTLEAGMSDYRGYSAPELENFMATLAAATENMVRLVDSLIDINRIEAGTLALHPESLAPGDLVTRAAAHFKDDPRPAAAGIRLAVADGLPRVHGDEKRVIAIIERLIDNAIRYTAGGGAITVSAEPDGAYVKFSVSDTGIGISERDQTHIFEKFFRTAGAFQMQTEGAGTGLYIARAVIAQLGGTINFTSAEGKGSRFSFTLPIDRARMVQ